MTQKNSKNLKFISFLFLFFFILLVSLKIHFSSIGVWNYFNPDIKKEFSKPLLNDPLSIRSDEWLVNTPNIFSQLNSGMKEKNLSVGSEKAPLLSYIPVFNEYSILRVQFFGFYLLPIEYGFSYFWIFKLLFLLYSSYLFLQILLPNSKIGIPLFGAIWICFSSYTQWWFSSNLPEILAFGFFTISSFWILILSRKISTSILWGILFLISAFNFVVFLYPPYQIQIVWIGIFVLIFPIFTLVKKISLKNNLYKVGFIVLTLFVSGLVIISYLLKAKSTIAVITETSYPGKRFFFGGGLSMERLFSGFMDIFYQVNLFPKGLENVCEASNYLILFPFLFILLLFHSDRKKIFTKNPIFLLLSILFLFILCYSFFQIPEILAFSTGAFLVPLKRIYFGIGILNIILCCYALFILEKNRSDFNFLSILLNPFLIITIIVYVYNKFNFVIRMEEIFLFSTLTILFLVLPLIRKTNLAILLYSTLLIFYGSKINPISKNISGLINDPLYNKFQSFQSQNPNKIWITNDTQAADLFKSTGATFVNGTMYTPHLKILSKISDSVEDKKIYNRYGHVSIQFTKMEETDKFKLLHPDAYSIKLPMNQKYLRNLGIDFVVLKSKKKDLEDLLKNQEIQVIENLLGDYWILKI